MNDREAFLGCLYEQLVHQTAEWYEVPLRTMAAIAAAGEPFGEPWASLAIHVGDPRYKDAGEHWVREWLKSH